MSDPGAEQAMERDYFSGGKRCALRKSTVLDDWWVGTSPRNGDDALVEGPWEHWLVLAHKIVEASGFRVVPASSVLPEDERALLREVLAEAAADDLDRNPPDGSGVTTVDVDQALIGRAIDALARSPVLSPPDGERRDGDDPGLNERGSGTGAGSQVLGEEPESGLFYLCGECGFIRPEGAFEFLRYGEDELEPAPSGRSDPLVKCPCGDLHSDDDSDSGLWGGSLDEMFAERKRLLADDGYDWGEHWRDVQAEAAAELPGPSQQAPADAGAIPENTASRLSPEEALAGCSCREFWDVPIREGDHRPSCARSSVLTPLLAKAVDLALTFGVPDPEPPEITEARSVLRALASSGGEPDAD